MLHATSLSQPSRGNPQWQRKGAPVFKNVVEGWEPSLSQVSSPRSSYEAGYPKLVHTLKMDSEWKIRTGFVVLKYVFEST